LVPYTGPTLTIEGELNKVASNVATGRDIAGVHWRSDTYSSLRIGQAVAISILQEQTLIHNEANPFYTFRGFDGERIVAANGGVWKSTNGGLSMTPIFDDQPVHSIGAVTINQAHPDIVWVGTGEGNVRNSVSIGHGVYRTLDGGKTWAHLGLEKTERIPR